MMSTIGVVGFTPRPTPPEGGWHATFVEEDHQAMRAMDLFMLEQALIDFSKLSPSHKDRTDHRNVLLSWSRDLGRGCGLTGILGDDLEAPIRQQADFWLLSGAHHQPSTEQLHPAESPGRERGIPAPYLGIEFVGHHVNRDQPSVPTGQNPARSSMHQSRHVEAVPSGNPRLHAKQLEHLRIAFHNAAYAAFDLSSSVYAIPKSRWPSSLFLKQPLPIRFFRCTA